MAVFSCLRVTFLTTRKRTAVYIDGYNLYYGRLRGSGHKWLDLVQLFRTIVGIQDPTSDLLRVRFFTAPALGNFASHGQASVVAQSAYHRALQHLYPDCFDITLGSHTYDPNGSLMPIYVDGQGFDRTNRTRVWRLEEKQTDVNLALAMYRDAAKGDLDQIVLCSNDRDAEPALKAIAEDFPSIVLGVITPVRPPREGGHQNRRLSGSLVQAAHWARQHLLDEELAAAQLPEVIPTSRKPIRKPEHW